MFKQILISLVLLGLLTACNRDTNVDYPNKPFINYQEMNLSVGKDSLGNPVVAMDLDFDYVDGDFNIGGSIPNNEYGNVNGAIALSVQKNGKIHLLDTAIYNNPRFFFIPKMEEPGRSYENDSVWIYPHSLNEGELKVQLLFDYPMVEYNNGDTAVISIRIVDRNLNFSNVVEVEQVVKF